MWLLASVLDIYIGSILMASRHADENIRFIMIKLFLTQPIAQWLEILAEKNAKCFLVCYSIVSLIKPETYGNYTD